MKKISEQIKMIVDENPQIDELTLDVLLKAYNHTRKLEEDEQDKFDKKVAEAKMLIDEAYNKKGYSAVTIAKALGVSYPTIFKVIDGLELKIRTQKIILSNVKNLKKLK